MKKRKWMLPVLVIILILIGVSCSKHKDNQEKIQWEMLSLGDILPKPEGRSGELHWDDESELRVDIAKTTEQQYKAYIEACKEMGFTIDSETTSFSYEAYNQDGYKVRLSYYASVDELSIDLEAPMEMKKIAWPNSEIAALLPVPESNIGNISWERADGFLIFVGDITKESYDNYVNECAEQGFDIDYEKGDSYYRADNQNGYHMSCGYEGFNIMSVQIDAPAKAEDKPSQPAVTEKFQKIHELLMMESMRSLNRPWTVMRHFLMNILLL